MKLNLISISPILFGVALSIKREPVRAQEDVSGVVSNFAPSYHHDIEFRILLHDLHFCKA